MHVATAPRLDRVEPGGLAVERRWRLAGDLVCEIRFTNGGDREARLEVSVVVDADFKDEPGYNPISYHNGSIWPHDTTIAVFGLCRYGFRAEAAGLAASLLAAAEHFPDARLPETFAGEPAGVAAEIGPVRARRDRD